MQMSKAKREARKLAKKQKKQVAKTLMLKKAKDSAPTITKLKKKHWYFIVAPKSFNERVLGKTLVTEADVLVGRAIRSNVMELTGDVKKQSTVITFKIDSIKDNKAVTVVHKYELMPAAVRRLQRRDQDKLEMSFIVKTKEGSFIKIKPVLVTRSKSHNSVRAALFRETKKFIADYFGKNPFDACVADIIYFKLQSTLKNLLNKVCPLRVCDIKFLERVSQVNAAAVVSEEPKVAEEENKEEESKEDDAGKPESNAAEKTAETGEAE